jgi:four helix bundle protein
MEKRIVKIVKYKSFEEVPVWQTAHEAVLKIYLITKKFPREEIYGLTSQIRRSTASIPANIAEGFYRNTTKELISFLYNARGSCGETIYHLMLARDLKYIPTSKFKSLYFVYNDISKQLNNWINSLKRKI